MSAEPGANMATMRDRHPYRPGGCPGLNVVIRAVTRRALDRGDEVVGILHGWRGLILHCTRLLGTREISGIPPRGGTILRTSRTNPFKVEGGLEGHAGSPRRAGRAGPTGGEDTLGVAARLHAEHDAPAVGVPKTIDNDLSATDYTFGSTRRLRSRPRPSTGCTRPPSRMTASWSAR